jgi:hypothetical protein
MAFALLVVVNTGAAQTGQQSEDRQSSPVKKSSNPLALSGFSSPASESLCKRLTDQKL